MTWNATQATTMHKRCHFVSLADSLTGSYFIDEPDFDVETEGLLIFIASPATD